MASITYQVEQCVREVDMIGRSKRDARREGKKGIHSHKTKKEVLKIGKQFARWVRERYGVKNLHEINEQHYVDFLASKSHTTLDYRRSIETHLRLVQEGLQKRSDRFEKERTVFIPEKRLIESRGRLEGVSDRSYSEQEIQAIKQRVTLSTARSIALMRNLGLRVSESVSVRVKDVGEHSVYIKGKGGRERYVSIPNHFRSELNALLGSKGANEKLVNVVERVVQNDLNKVCKELNIRSRGTHGFRHTYARDRMGQLMTAEERTLFSSCMDRYAEGKSFDYGVHNRELYNSMKTKMDLVHAELGHGKNRFDLAVRYMR